MHKSILHFKSTATEAWQEHRGNLVEYADGGQRAMKKYHATSFSFINPDTGKAELLPFRCARVHGGRTSDMNDNTDETLTMLRGIAERMDLPEKTKLAATFSVCSILAAMGDRAANQAAHNRWIREQVQAAMEQLPNWDDMSEENKTLFTTVIEASCGIHAICNIATGRPLAKSAHLHTFSALGFRDSSSWILAPLGFRGS